MSRKKITEITMGAPLDNMPSKINHPFGEKRSYEIHPGVDLSTPSGTPVKAPMDGIVVNVNNNGPLCGGTIDIDYKNGFWSRFCHIKRIDVSKGQVVNKGQVVGLSGGAKNDPQRGNSKGAHLHFTLKKDGKLVDPMNYINKFNVGTSEFPMSAATQSSDLTNWDDFFGKETSQMRDKLRKKDPLLTKILEPLAKMKFFEYSHKKILNVLIEEYNIKWADTYSSTEYHVKEGEKLQAPESGEVVLVGDHRICKNSIIIQHNISKNKVFTLFCNVEQPTVRKGNNVTQGKKIGLAGKNCFIKVMDKDFSEIKFSTVLDLSKTKGDNVGGDEEKQRKINKERKRDPILGALMKPLDLLNIGQIKSASDTDKVPEFKAVSWLKKNTTSKNESINRDISKIKRLL